MAQNQDDPDLTPELLQWALEQINEEEIVAGIREIRETGGFQFNDFIDELEAIVSSEPPT
jgi:hypothetical protein